MEVLPEVPGLFVFQVVMNSPTASALGEENTKIEKTKIEITTLAINFSFM
jgi:hypothetical protein